MSRNRRPVRKSNSARPTQQSGRGLSRPHVAPAVAGSLKSASCPPWHFVVIALLPAWLWVLNDNWCFQNIGNMDPWYYFGQFRHYPQFQRLTPTYPGERLLWILPGYVLTRIFGHVNGVIALHAAIFVGSLLLIHYVLRHIADSATALLATVLLGSYPCFIGSNGWDYVESMPILLFCASLALLVRIRITSGQRLVILLSGICWFSLIYTFLAWAAFTPFYVALAVWFSDRSKGLGRAALSTTGMILAGGLITTAGLSLIYRMLGIPGFFYRVTIQTAWNQYFISANPWIDPNWVRQCTWLVFPIIAFCAAAYWIFQSVHKRTASSDGNLPFLGLYAGCFLMMVLLTINKNRLLGFDYDASILTPTVFVTLALTILRPPAALPLSRFYLVAGVGVVISTLPLRVPGLLHYLLHWQLIGPATIVLLVYGCAIPSERRRTAWSGAVLIFALLSSCLTPAYSSQAWKSRYRGRDISVRVSRAIDTVLQNLPEGQYPVFWFDNFNDPLGGEFRGIVCAFIAHGYSMDRYPAVDMTKKFAPGQRMFLLTRQGEQAKPAELLHSAGTDVVPVSNNLIAEGGISYWISQFEVRSSKPQHSEAVAGAR